MTKLENNILTTCKGEIVSMNIAKPWKNSFANDRLEYEAKLKFDAKTKEGAELKAALLEINPKKVITSVSEKQKARGITIEGDEFIVKFVTTRQPKVLDQEGKELIGMDIPYFFQGKSTGNAIVKGLVYTKGKMNTVYLNEIQLFDMYNPPKEESCSAEELDIETKISAAHKNITKG